MNPKLIEKALTDADLEFDRVNDSTIHYVRQYEGIPIAQYYVDYSNSVPPETELYDFQYELMGDAYFNHPELQWSSYLYFILDDTKKEQLGANEIASVEHDTSFARKLVLTPQEFRSRLTDRPATAEPGSEASNIEATWFQLLARHGFEKSVFTRPEASLDSRRESIRLATSPAEAAQLSSASAETSIPNGETLLEPFRTVQTKGFRKKLDGRSFDFTDVTLIQGPNGSGKTSLLEALEFFYCGNVRRDQIQRSAETTVSVTFESGRGVITTGKTGSKTFRDRNLVWYGIKDRRSSSLHDSFSIYNFLNVDAAASFEQQRTALDGSMQEALSVLLVGTSAAIHWREIQRLSEDIPAQSRACDRSVKDLEERLKTAKSFEKALLAARRKSDAAREAARSSFERLNWELGETRDAIEVSALQGEVDELNGVLSVPSEIRSLASPATLDAFQSAAKGLKSSISRRASSWKKYDDQIETLGQLEEDREALETWEGLVDLADSYLAEEFSRAVSDQKAARARIAELDALAEISIPDLTGFELYMKLSPLDSLANAESQYASIVDRLSDATSSRDSVKNATSELNQLTAALASMAHQIRQHRGRHGTHESCPLCQAEYSPSELTTRISRATRETGSTVLADLEETVTGLELEAKRAKDFAEFLLSLVTVAGGSQWSSLADAVAGVAAAELLRSSETIKLSQLDESLERLKRRGFSEHELEEVIADLRERLGASAETDLKSLIVDSRKKLRRSHTSLDRRLESANRKSADALSSIRDSLETRQRSAEKLAELEDAAEERLEIAMNYLETANSGSLILPGDKPIAETKRLLRSCSVQLAKLSAELRRESELEKSATGSSGAIATELETKQAESDQWKAANQIFEEIVHDHSLEAATSEELAANQELIEWVFNQIQAPDDFEGLSPGTVSTLARKDGTPAQLNQVSTGQRAALALSIFLAMNFRAKNAPPLILIDDPVAHVDDINTVAFLDYLRDTAIDGGRQIVFATASSKLAGLFRRKFEFLGEDRFSEINLKPDG